MGYIKSLINKVLPQISKSDDQKNLPDPKSSIPPDITTSKSPENMKINQTPKDQKNLSNKNKLFNNVPKKLPKPEKSDDDLDYKPFVENFLDPMLKEAAILIVRNQQCAVSFLQRKLKLGYSRAARIVDQLEEAEIVGPNTGNKNRSVLIKEEKQLEEFFRKIQQ